MSDIYYYELENRSRSTEEYQIRVFEEKIYEHIFPSATTINEVKVIPTDSQPVLYSAENLSRYISDSEHFIELSIPIRLEPRAKVKIVCNVSSIKAARDLYSYIVARPVINLRLTVFHPPDLNVKGVPLHSSEGALITENDGRELKIWRIDAAILPWQGLELSWAPITVS
jgi:hypothetical protein